MTDFTPRPTVYKGIQMRSRLEAGFAAWLDRSRLRWEYEPFAVGDEHGQYLPDFVIKSVFTMPGLNELVDVAVEVKPTTSVIDFPRLHRAAAQIGPTGLPAMLVLVIADLGTFAVFSTPTAAEGTGGLMPMTWMFHDDDGESTVALTFAAVEAPFAVDWWK